MVLPINSAKGEHEFLQDAVNGYGDRLKIFSNCY